MNCGRLPAEHDPWPQCPDGGEGWRKRLSEHPYVTERREILRDLNPAKGGQDRPRHSGAWWLGAGLVALVLLLSLISFANPHVNVPLVSPVVCSLKGDTWYGGGILGPPGCYQPSG